ncbi:glycerol-3-phosphate phosphatase-like [Topomyia yanbarensis]|uniref:glycerol-3-phosphate phosphatase-like n=1 Tax=Topomyia yanbarensis TaxID=2498891 RepID=UPI00273BC52D|nr:glycerol-3-phosphate phosphatase-like [Topomyia yanbarensis]
MRSILSKRLLDLSPEDKQRFVDSFDYVLTDCDGVVWNTYGPTEGAGDAISELKGCGKHLVYVSNNSVRSLENYQEQVRNLGHEVAEEDVITPVFSVVKYLKSIEFQGLIYGIGSVEFLKVLQDAGYEVISGPNEPMPEMIRLIAPVIYDKKPVKAVIIDFDYNCNNIKLLRAQMYLKGNPDCMLIAGPTDYTVAVSTGFQILGPGYYVDILEKSTGRKATILGKPGHLLGEMLKKQYHIKDSRRGLFVGDMIAQDVAVGKVAGFQTLLVLTGGAKLSDVEQLKDGDAIPDYYTESFADLGQVVKEVQSFKNKSNL